jgi:hypothetical protein
MPTFFKPLVLGLGLVAGIALTAQAQTAVTPGTSIANLPPVDQGPRVSSHGYQGPTADVAVEPSGTYPGPDPGVGWYPKGEQQTHAVEPSPPWQGPNPN